jgi:hypothetical protein
MATKPLTAEQKKQIDDAAIQDAKNKWTICVYSEISDELAELGLKLKDDDDDGFGRPDYTFHAKNKRQVVGLMNDHGQFQTNPCRNNE